MSGMSSKYYEDYHKELKPMELNIPIERLLADARAQEQNTIDNLPMLVKHGALSQEEADGVRRLCERAIAQIDAQAQL